MPIGRRPGFRPGGRVVIWRTMDAADTPDLSQAITTARPKPAPRVWRLEHGGKVYWVKERERTTLRMRLQKAIGANTFEDERDALHQLAARGAPVPPVVAEGPGYFALPDCGETLDRVLSAALWTPAKRLEVFADAGRTLAEMHGRGLSHGRPSLKDICWQDGVVRFIDLEYYADANNTLRGHGRDLVLFAYNAIVVGRGATPEMEAALTAYRAADPGGVWEAAETWCRRLRWANWATKPIQMRREGKAREFKAIPLTMQVFGAL